MILRMDNLLLAIATSSSEMRQGIDSRQNNPAQPLLRGGRNGPEKVDELKRNQWTI
jgi:hypothetical protein